MPSPTIPDSVTALLEEHQFDAELFHRHATALAAGNFESEHNRLTQSVSAPQPSDLHTYQPTEELISSGEKSIAAGQLAVCILNGGMATRFGGGVKGIVRALGDASFLALKLGQVAALQRQLDCEIPVFLLNSFATNDATERHLVDNDYFGLDKNQVHLLKQGISLRLTQQGELFLTKSGEPSPYAPGHGDVLDALRQSPAFKSWGVGGSESRHIWISNVDNLAASVEAGVLGAHLRAKHQVTVEVAARASGDKGGAPARVGERCIIVEGFRFPPQFDISSIPVFNTNTLLIEAQALGQEMPLTWFRADKVVDGKKAIQFERLMGEITSFTTTHYLTVPRQGSGGRFSPIKTMEDLDRLQDEIARWATSVGIKIDSK